MKESLFRFESMLILFQFVPCLISRDFVDAWKLLKYDDPGYTFNPEINEFASLNSESRKKKRIDRILLKYFFSLSSLFLANCLLDLKKVIGTQRQSI
jgi:hypothetical protein